MERPILLLIFLFLPDSFRLPSFIFSFLFWKRKFHLTVFLGFVYRPLVLSFFFHWECLDFFFIPGRYFFRVQRCWVDSSFLSTPSYLPIGSWSPQLISLLSFQIFLMSGFLIVLDRRNREVDIYFVFREVESRFTVRYSHSAVLCREKFLINID